MGPSELLVTAAGIVSIGGLAWFFFGPKESGRAELRGGVQEVEVTVRGGYSPSMIRVREGVPLRIAFDRQESGECTSEVVFSDFRMRRSLPAFARTTVELLPDRSGEFEFACGMNMVRGTLIVEPGDGQEIARWRRPPADRRHRDRGPQTGAVDREGRRRRGRRASQGDPRPAPAGPRGRRAHGTRADRGHGGRALRCPGSRAPHEPVVPARSHHAGVPVHGMAHPHGRVEDAAPPDRRDEHPHHRRDDGGLRVQPPGHRLPRRGSRRGPGCLLRGRRGHPHPDPAGPALRGAGEGRDR